MQSVKCKMKNEKPSTQIILHFTFLIFHLIEPLARIIQLQYMKKRRSTEIILPRVLRFHPLDARLWVKGKLAQKLRRYKIPLDKIFYDR